jgi:hypothetical protein
MFTRAYGALGAIGSGLGTAAEAVGGALESAVPSGVSTGIANLGQGLQSLFGTGSSEAAHLAELGQAVPEGVELVGPSSTFTGPGFLGGMMQGFVNGPQQFANPSAGTSIGQGVGGLLSALEQMHGQRGGGGGLQAGPIIRNVVGQLQGPQVIPSAPAKPEQGPIMKMIGQIFAGL